ncbi:MAG: [protein-PII] uridylyltransferase [Rhodospirillaceae bacterium]
MTLNLNASTTEEAAGEMINPASTETAPPVPAALALVAAPVITRRALNIVLNELAETHGARNDKLRPAVLGALRQALNEGRAEVRRQFEAGGGGEMCVRLNSDLMDMILRSLAEFAETVVYPSAGPSTGEVFGIAATGGYGRAEMCPQSDIDLLFLLPYKCTSRVEQIVEYMLYMLWDLGLKVGHAVRTVDDCLRLSKQDVSIRTNLLETRRLWGEGQLLTTLQRRLAKEVMQPNGEAFVVAKLAERDERHHRMGDSRYVLEPNVKEGKGGLRDLQTLIWIAKHLYSVTSLNDLVTCGVLLKEEATRFIKAQNFLWTVRCHLHYLTGRPEDRLTFDVQTEIGRRMGYTDHAGTVSVERFMKHYFLTAKDVGDLTRIFCAALEADSKRPPRFNLWRLGLGRAKEVGGFRLDGERLNLHHERQFREVPLDMLRLFLVARDNGLDIHPHALRALTRALGGLTRLRNDPEANRLFMEILTGRKDPEGTLRRMNEAGVLGRFLPDFGRVVAQMQYDMYHAYTVDEHTLQAIGILHKIDTGECKAELPLAVQVIHKATSRRALFVATLLHDVAKGRGGDHSVEGAKIAEKLCPRLGLTAEETETVSWLVRYHLNMSFTAFKRDFEDERTIRDFVKFVQSPERLRLLLVLTTADICAVGVGRWNAWKATLLTELYHRTEEVLAGGVTADGREHRIRQAQAALRARLTDFTETQFERHAVLGSPDYWLSLDTDTHARHARLILEAEKEGRLLTLDTRIDRTREVTEVTMYTGDHPGLFSQLAGALALTGANIVDAKIFTLRNGQALDIFSVQDAHSGGAFEAPDKLARLKAVTEQALAGQVRLYQELSKRKASTPHRTRMFKVPPRVMIDNTAGTNHTVIEVNGRDRPGLLFEVTRTLTELGLQISSAKISTYGEKVIDVFYVRDVYGLKVTHDAKLQRIRERLLLALTGSPPPGSSAPAPKTTPPVSVPGEQRRRARRKTTRTP